MTRRELIEYCLTFPDAYEDYPFDEDAASPAAWAVMRHGGNKKGFAFIYERGGLCVNLKCEPMRAEFLRQVYPNITPAYHMNKTHWNTVRIEELPEDEEAGEVLAELIGESYRLTR